MPSSKPYASWRPVVETPLLLTVTGAGADVVEFAAPSRATALRTCVPLTSPRVSQGTEYGLVLSSAPRFWPLSLNWTPTSP